MSYPVDREDLTFLGKSVIRVDRETSDLSEQPTNSESMLGEIGFRKICDEDSEFLFSVYKSMRDWELAQTQRTVKEVEKFLRNEFQAQYDFYRTKFPDGRYDVITLGSKDIGRRILINDDEALLFADLTLLPEFRGKGLGRKIVEFAKDEAKKVGKVIRYFVRTGNEPTKRCSVRFGFRQKPYDGDYDIFEWSPTRE